MGLYNYELFPVLVSRVSDFLSREQCNDIIEFFKNRPDEFAPHRFLTNNAISNHSLGSRVDLLVSELPSCSDFSSKLKKEITDYSERTGIAKCEIVNSWVSVQNVGSRLLQHKHVGASISGAIYLKVDDDSSRLVFDNPNPYASYTLYHKHTKFSHEYFALQPEVGDLVLFPSWLSHGSGEDVNETDDRTIISFNVNF